jgi:hypothetical protein
MSRRIFSACAAVALLGAAAYEGRDTMAVFWRDRPVQQTAYYGVDISDGKSEVEYKLGVPPNVVGPVDESQSGWRRAAPVYDVSADPSKDTNAMPHGRDFVSFDEWSYSVPSDPGGHLSIMFDPETKKVREIGCFSSSVTRGSCNGAAGVNVGDNEADVKSNLGAPMSEELSGVSKSLTYSKLNVKLYLTKQKVYMIEIGLFPTTQR